MEKNRQYWNLFGAHVGNITCGTLTCAALDIEHKPNAAESCVFVLRNTHDTHLSASDLVAMQEELSTLRKSFEKVLKLPVSRINFDAMLNEIGGLYGASDRLHWLSEGIAIFASYEVAFSTDEKYARVLLITTRMVLECITRRSKEAFLYAGEQIFSSIKKLKEIA